VNNDREYQAISLQVYTSHCDWICIFIILGWGSGVRY
jgi:hypothetical protein